jgi:hypothetical protein
MIDIHGAEWLGPELYRLVESAERYEQYEVNFAAKVRSMFEVHSALDGTDDAVML